MASSVRLERRHELFFSSSPEMQEAPAIDGGIGIVRGITEGNESFRMRH